MGGAELPDLGYGTYAQLPFAQSVVRWGVGKTGIRPGDTVLDIGAGTGDSTAAILEAMTFGGICHGRVVAIEPNAESLAIAEERLVGQPVRFHRCTAGELDGLDYAPGAFRVAVWSNGIHYLTAEEELARALAAIRRVTAERFCAWSTFVKGAYEGLTTRFAGLWVLKAYELLGIRREKRSENLQERGFEEYAAAFLDAGFAAASGSFERFELKPEVWEAIAAFGDYAERALPYAAIELRERSKALVEAVRPVFNRLRVDAVPRNWLFLDAAI